MVPRLSSSPKARRRLAKAAGALALVAAAFGAAQLLPDGRNDLRDVAAPSRQAAPRATPPAPKQVPLRHGDRRAIDRALDRFVPVAVRRSDPAAAYDLVTPALRAGTSRAEWAAGSIAVQPFPARGERFHHWTLSYSYPNHVGLELLLRPVRQAGVGPIAFAVDVKRIGGRWLVDSFIPAAVFSAAGAAPRISAVPDYGPNVANSSPGATRLDPRWFLLPAALLVLSLVVLIGYALATWLNGRRAVRAYEAGRTNARALPPLPARTRSRMAVARVGRNR